MNRKNILFLISAVAVLFLMNAVFGQVNITRAANLPVTGYAWSDNIGWIQMNSAFGGVQIDDSTGNFSGYAWSDNIGWIDFAPTGGYPETPNNGAKLDLSTGQITGWIKALSAANGWDGWIKMGGAGSEISVPSGYTYNPVTGKGESDPSCPSGGTYSATNNRCEADLITTSTPVTQYQCPSTGTLYSTQSSCDSVCRQTVSCTANYNEAYCYSPQGGQVCSIYGSTPGFCMDGMPECSTVGVGGGGVLGPFGSYECPELTESYQGCFVRYLKYPYYTYSCPLSGGTACDGSNQCSAAQACTAVTTTTTTTSCPSGYSQSGSVCIATAACSSGGILNTATDKCEVDPIIGGGGGVPFGGNINLSDGDFSGYAWGSDVVGWVSFSGDGYGTVWNNITQCNNGIDDDGNGCVDGSDSGCVNSSDTAESGGTCAVTQCNDGLDNDGNGCIDGSDTGCVNSSDTTESGGSCIVTQCNDGLDNDGNGCIDGSDTGCVNSSDATESGGSCVVTQCNNGIDDDSNGCADGNDLGCVNSSDTTESGGSCVVLSDFSLNNSNAIFVSLIEGASSGSTETTITASPLNSFANDIFLSVDSVSPALSGATFNFGDQSLSSAEYPAGTSFSVNAPAGTSSGLYTITIKGEGGGLIRTVNVQLNVEAVEPSWIEI